MNPVIASATTTEINVAIIFIDVGKRMIAVKGKTEPKGNEIIDETAAAYGLVNS